VQFSLECKPNQVQDGRACDSYRTAYAAGRREIKNDRTLLLSGQVFLQTEDHMKTLLEMKTCTYSSDGVQERGPVQEQAWVTEMAEAGQVAGALTPLSAWCQLPAQ